MIVAFMSGLLLGGAGGMLSWLAAAAYLQAQHDRIAMAGRGANAQLSRFAPEMTFANAVEQEGQRRRPSYRPLDRAYTTPSAGATKATSRRSSSL